MSVNNVLQLAGVEDYLDSLFNKCATADDVISMELLLISHIRQYGSFRISVIKDAKHKLSKR